MTDTNSASKLAIARGALPLRIEHVDLVPDPVLNMWGADWSSNFMCGWIIESSDVVIDRLHDKEVVYDERNLLTGEDLSFLVGREIIGITAGSEMIDPVFHISGEVLLRVHADTDLDPWVLSIPGGTLVGSSNLG